GPLALLDLVGLDTSLAILDALYEEFKDPNYAPQPLLKRMVSAGQLVDHEGIVDLSVFPTVPAIDLPEGEWIALRVEGDSMNKISPPGSVVFTNIRDRRLVHNACYVVADETGAATYKRYRVGDTPPFQPASYHDVEPPALQGAIRIVGRVRRSVIDL
ncbi:MAG: 3-hydroxyacyl-CoA dehydrogenase family protein, partial [Rhizobiaceae bacterium]|nr:3-hydroxyacyl-CoA dehydrogenase family protein [Rhizobiaceae bacterium]